ncbi:MAG: inositol monophosphatase family protein [Rhodospirillales bacterium]
MTATAIPPNDRLFDILRSVSETAILPRFRRLSDDQVRAKGHADDLVTVADIESEDLLTQALTALLPGSRVIGEEAAAENSAVLLELQSDAPVWIIDPVDGTYNFAHGNERFCVIVALVLRGETLAGWLHDPLNDRTAWSLRGEGAWMTRHGAEMETQALRVADEKPIQAMRGSLSRNLSEKVRGWSKPRPAGIVRYRCIGHEYMDLAAGEIDFGRYGGRLKPWDHAAGALLVTEAGGRAAFPDGKPYRPQGALDKTLFVAPADSWVSLRDVFC